MRLDAGISSTFTRAGYDAAFGTFPDTPSTSDQLLRQVWAKATIDSLGGMLTQSISTFATQTVRSFNDISYGADQTPANTYQTISDYIGNSVGAEYQAHFAWARQDP